MSYGVWHSETGFCKAIDVDKETAERIAEECNSTRSPDHIGYWYADEMTEFDIEDCKHETS